MRRPLIVTGLVILAAGGLATVWASTFTADPTVQVSVGNPLASCTADNVSTQPGTVYLDSEVEPIVAVNPTDPLNIVGGWQQDRWSNGGARGLVAGVSTDGGLSWTSVVIPKIAVAPGHERRRVHGR